MNIHLEDFKQILSNEVSIEELLCASSKEYISDGVAKIVHEVIIPEKKLVFIHDKGDFMGTFMDVPYGWDDFAKGHRLLIQ